MTTLDADLALALNADLGESPVWHAATQELLSVDIFAGRIHAFAPATQALRTVATGATIGCIAPRANGQLIAALASGLAAVDLGSGNVTPLLTPREHDVARCRFNDGKCDPQGRFWAGTMSVRGESSAGALYCFPNATTAERVLGDVGVSNGLAWSRDGATLYFIDSPTRRVDAFDFDGGSGRLSQRRTAIEFPSGCDVPDGCTIDDDGMLWAAHWDGSGVSRWDPRTGRQLAFVRVPAPRVTSCTFGDADRGTLYITTARRGLSAERLATFPASGALFACRPGVTGPAAMPFRG